ncbi:hypothetical protein DJ78_14165 [Halorubrum ezzemoulense]|uniref:Uncharacterized protein n=1 Tax=Halorubrum ezzemoulense TaxID=337243 RepID=A0A256JGS6_HALEZ|nr:hypothetical protein DJ78_14165 [Halorubrum ezzemoulense]
MILAQVDELIEGSLFEMLILGFWIDSKIFDSSGLSFDSSDHVPVYSNLESKDPLCEINIVLSDLLTSGILVCHSCLIVVSKEV